MEPEMDDYRSASRISTPPQNSPGSVVVQPILISPNTSHSIPAPTRARAPPSLIPISSFTTPFKGRTQQATSNVGVLRVSSSSPSHSSQERKSVTQFQDDAEDLEDNKADEWVNSPPQSATYPISTAPLVSTSSHSILSGVKLHIRRASPASQLVSPKLAPPSHEPMDVDYSEESEEYAEGSLEATAGDSSSSNSSNLTSILNAIRSNTSLTIEEVPADQFSAAGVNIGRTPEFVRSGNDKVEVFIVPQQSNRNDLEGFSTPSPFSSQRRATGAKRGRPKRAISVVQGEGGLEEMQEIGGSRRTARDRKPTKHFTPDFSRFRGFKKRGMEIEPTKTEESRFPDTPDSDRDEVEEIVQSAEIVEIEESPEVISPVRKRRGRPSTGRARGRPRGSTRKPKPENLSDPNSKPDETLESGKIQAPLAPSDVESSPTSSKKVVRAPRGTKAARGGSRGGKRITKAQKIQNAKLKKLLSKRKDSLQLFEEETRMSSDVKPGIGIACSAENEDASNSTNTSTTTKQKKQTKGPEIEEQRPVTADTLFEYHWPVDDPLAEIFFLQEQVSEYLGVKSFKRKYPDLKRRTVEMAERDFLRGQKIVTEMQCDLGLTALQSNHVLEIMFKDFPEKYEEYRQVVQERRDKEYVKQKTQHSTSSAAARDKGAEFMRRILNSAATWNSKLNRQRTDERSCCYDQQTCTMNIQRSKFKVLPPHATKMGYYPVSVLPGQYTDGYIKYSSAELKYLPLNTVSFGPVIENHFNNVGSDDSSDSDGSSSSSDDSSSSSDSDEKDGPDDQKRSSNASGSANSSGITTSVVGENGTAGIQSVSCKTCEGDVHKNKDGQFEVLIQCTKCDVANHPTCLELSLDMLPFIKKYNWQCSDCKNCIECNDPADEDKMLFCDLCDRGYHIYCVGLRKVPTGRWHCRICSVCYSCGNTKSATDERGTEWHHEFRKGEKGSKIYSHSICVTCHKLFKKGQFCPTCNKSHHKIDDKTLLECKICDKLVHKECARRQQPMGGILCDPCDVASRATAKSKTTPRDSFVKQNFYFY